MITTIPSHMAAVQLTGFGEFDQLVYRTDVQTPTPAADEVLIRVAAASINNTDINTRIGWYASSSDDGSADRPAWSGAALEFPRIQGADCCGRIVVVGAGVDERRIDERVLVRPMQSLDDPSSPLSFETLGADMDGAFAQYVTVKSKHACAVNSRWSDIDLASLPCAYSTAEGMLTRANATAERILITGASGGVGSAAVQLAKCRGAEVIAIAAKSKAEDVRRLGADHVVNRGKALGDAIDRNSIDVVVDVVGGPQWPELCDLLRPGGRYVTSGAIAGPHVELDLRKLYLKDLTFFGSTHQSDDVFARLIGYVERDEIRAVVAKTYPLRDVVVAQQDFLAKQHTGKLVLLPPHDTD